MKRNENEDPWRAAREIEAKLPRLRRAREKDPEGNRYNMNRGFSTRAHKRVKREGDE